MFVVLSDRSTLDLAQLFDLADRDEDDTAFEECLEQIAENHRVGNIHNGKLVEADDASLLGESVRGQLQGVLLMPQSFESGVDGTHETMEVLTPLVFEG